VIVLLVLLRILLITSIIIPIIMVNIIVNLTVCVYILSCCMNVPGQRLAGWRRQEQNTVSYE